MLSWPQLRLLLWHRSHLRRNCLTQNLDVTLLFCSLNRLSAYTISRFLLQGVSYWSYTLNNDIGSETEFLRRCSMFCPRPLVSHLPFGVQQPYVWADPIP